MQTKTVRILIALSFIATAVVATGCAAETEDGDLLEITQEEEFLEAIPGDDILNVEMDGETRSQALTVEQAAEGALSKYRGEAGEVIRTLREMRVETHVIIRALVDNAQASAVVQDGNKECRAWVTNGERNTWRLLSCREDARAKKYAFSLSGRPLASADDADYLPIFAGRGVVLRRHENRQRGAGLVAYNFDNIATLTDEDIQGKMVVGYRAAAGFRQINLGLDKIKNDQGNVISALYRLNHAVGLGGSIHYLTKADFLALDDAGELIEGMDDIDEAARVGAAWTNAGAGRTVQVVCGGTLGERCIRVHQCWTTDGSVSFEEQVNGDAAPNWEATACAAVEFDVDEPMDEDALSPDGDVTVETPSE